MSAQQLATEAADSVCDATMYTAYNECDSIPGNIEYGKCIYAADSIHAACKGAAESGASPAPAAITPNTGSSGVMYVKGQTSGVNFGPFVTSTGGGAAFATLAFEKAAEPHCTSTKTPNCPYTTRLPTMATCAIDAASALNAEAGAPSRVYCFQQTTLNWGNLDDVYMAKCTDTDTDSCPTLPVS